VVELPLEEAPSPAESVEEKQEELLLEEAPPVEEAPYSNPQCD
jgi:hypothetical protein